MAGTNTKKAAGNRPKHSGFDAPAFGTVYPKGTRFETNPDGTERVILPPGGRAKKTRETSATRKKK